MTLTSQLITAIKVLCEPPQQSFFHFFFTDMEDCQNIIIMSPLDLCVTSCNLMTSDSADWKASPNQHLLVLNLLVAEDKITGIT